MSIARDLAWYAVLVASTAAFGLPGRATAAALCDAAATEATAVAQARTAVHRACGCTGAAQLSEWRRCVAQRLKPLVDAGALTRACRRYVRRVENRSICGRPGKIVCCRTFRDGRVVPRLRREDDCTAPPEGSACVSPSPYIADSCALPGCEVLPGCDNSVIEPGETCDPPDGATCNAQCAACTADVGTTLLGCTANGTEVAAAATAEGFLAAWTEDDASFVSHAVARRLGADGAFRETVPFEVSGTIPDTTVSWGFASGATADETSFYVGWFASDEGAFNLYFAGRRIPPSGPIVAPVDLLVSRLRFGACGTSIGGPLGLAPTLDSTSIHFTYRVIVYCIGTVLYENIAGLGAPFSSPPGNVSTGTAPLARGADDVAGVWWNILVPPPPLDPVYTLQASFIEPGAPAISTLTSGTSSVSPALAALGDVFVAFFTTGGELRAVRFTRADGPLDPDGGLLVATAGGTIGAVAAASDGARAIAAWRESSGPGTSAVRAIRLAPDGTALDPMPIDVAVSDASAAVSVASNPAGAFVAFTRGEGPATSVRGVLLPP